MVFALFEPDSELTALFYLGAVVVWGLAAFAGTTMGRRAGGLELGKIAAHLVPLHPKQHLSQRGRARTGRRRHRGKWCDPAAVPRV